MAFTATNHNQTIAFALSDRYSIDPKVVVKEGIGERDISTLFAEILQLREPKVPLSNEDEVMNWVSFASGFPVEDNARHDALNRLNEELSQKSVLLGDGLQPSEADIVVFSAVHSVVSHLTDADTKKWANVIRWFDYVQNKIDFGGALGKIVVHKPEFEPLSLKKVEKADGGQLVNKSNQGTKTVDKKEENIQKKGDSEIQKKVSSAKAPEASKKDDKKDDKAEDGKKKVPEKDSAEKEAECSVSILNIQIGLIRKAWKHPSADSLLVEEIDIGDGNLRQVVSGLAKFYGPDDLTNCRVVLITNVKPGKLRDVMSAGLVLCASNQDHTVVEPLIPPEGTSIGERVTFSGYDGKPEDVLNPKKKQLEKITPYLCTDDKGVATFKGVPFMTSAGPCTSSICNATVK